MAIGMVSISILSFPSTMNSRFIQFPFNYCNCKSCCSTDSEIYVLISNGIDVESCHSASLHYFPIFISNGKCMNPMKSYSFPMRLSNIVIKQYEALGSFTVSTLRVQLHLAYFFCFYCELHCAPIYVIGDMFTQKLMVHIVITRFSPVSWRCAGAAQQMQQ